MRFPKASRVAESVDRRWVVGAPVGVDVVAEPDAGSDTALPPLVRHGGRGFNGRWVVMHRGERRRSNRTTDPRRELITRSGCRDADRPGAICHHRCFFGFFGFCRLDFAKIRDQQHAYLFRGKSRKTIRTRPRFDPTLDLTVRRLTEPRVKYLSVSKIQEAGHWRPHHGARTPPVTARRRVAPDTPSRLQSRLQSRAGPKQVRATPSQHKPLV